MAAGKGDSKSCQIEITTFLILMVIQTGILLQPKSLAADPSVLELIWSCQITGQSAMCF